MACSVSRVPAHRSRAARLPSSSVFWLPATGVSAGSMLTRTTAGLATTQSGCIVADERTGSTSRQLVFAGGDAVSGAATVILAAGAGKRAAAAIHEALNPVVESTAEMVAQPVA